ncbi:TPA: hypothetical protein ACGXGL_001071 [Pseudomonas aeruginosa]
MGRPVNTAWFNQYRQVMMAFERELPKGLRRDEVLESHARTAGYSVATFARILKAGRFLDTYSPNLDIERVKCGYALVEVLDKLSKVDPHVAHEWLPKVLSNAVSLAELSALYEQQANQNPVANAIVSRDGARRRASLHERESAAAIIRAGVEFFGAPHGRLLKLSQSTSFVAPSFLVCEGKKPLTAILIRTGTASKDSLQVALDLLDLAIAQRTRVSQVWYVLPSDSPVIDLLAAIAKHLEISPVDDGWLHLAVLDSQTTQLARVPKGRYLTMGANFVLEHGAECVWWEGIDVVTGEEDAIKYVVSPTWSPEKPEK